MRSGEKIDRGIGKVEPQEESVEQPEKPKMVDFQPCIGRIRKSGTGCITQISEHCWEGRYSPVWPDGKKHSRNIYGKTREECEAKLPALIEEMKAEIKAIKENGDFGAIPDGISKCKKRIMLYMREYPEVTNKSLIAREVDVNRTTVQRYYDELRKAMKI